MGGSLPQKALSIASPATWLVGAAYRSVKGFQTMQNAPRDAATQMSQAQAEQSRQAAAMQQKLLTQPKQIAPDDFLATRNKLLQNMRLGLASTISGASGAPSPVLSAPSLSAGAGKTKLGA